MKSLMIFLLLGTLSLFGEPDWACNYDAAYEKAKKENKGVMIMLSRKNCDACWYMENIVLEDEELMDRIEESFVPLYLDVHDDNIHGLAYIGTPTFYFKKSGGRTIKRIDGAMNIKEFTAAYDAIEEAFKK